MSRSSLYSATGRQFRTRRPYSGSFIIDICPVLILDANQRSALAVTRSLGRRGITVHTADDSPTALAAASRYSEAYLRYPNPVDMQHADSSDAFILAITDYCSHHDIGMVLPMTELTTNLLLANRSQLGQLILPCADEATIDRLADKCRLVELATELDIPCPTSTRVDALDDLPELESLDYPLVLKPGKSWLRTSTGWLHSAVRFATDADHARRVLADDAAFSAHPFMLQETVPGSGRGIFAIYNHGKAIAFFAHQRIHEKPPRGGVSVICESVTADPALLAHSRRLLDAVAWHGIAMVEFRAQDDPEEDGAWLMEVNTRFWGSLQLAVDSGIDFPWLLYQTALGEQVDDVTEYHRGCRMRWLLGDLDWLYLILKDAEFSIGKKLKAILAFCLWSPFTSRSEVNRLDDMGPFRWELREYLRHVKNRL